MHTYNWVAKIMFQYYVELSKMHVLVFQEHSRKDNCHCHENKHTYILTRKISKWNFAHATLQRNLSYDLYHFYLEHGAI
jgi:hypothetical protein